MESSTVALAGKKKHERVGAFVLVDEMPGGGHARIFRARYEPEARDATIALVPGDAAIIKVLRDNALRDSKALTAFSREAELMGMIEHPGVVRAVSRGVTSGRMWSALEYVEGDDVATLLLAMRQDSVRLRPELVVCIAADVLSGLAAAQALVDARGRSLGLIHRDITPKNVMIDVKGHAKLLDFGNALLSLREEPSAELIGTPGYLAPEQARGEQLTQGVDVYAIGLLMFELLCGTRAYPIDSYTDKALLEQHANNRRAPWPKSIDVPLELRAVVDQATMATPEQRPADAAALFALVDGLQQDADEARRRIALIAQDLAWSNPEKPAPLFMG